MDFDAVKDVAFSENDKLYANVKYVYIKDKIPDMFTIKLTEE